MGRAKAPSVLYIECLLLAALRQLMFISVSPVLYLYTTQKAPLPVAPLYCSITTFYCSTGAQRRQAATGHLHSSRASIAPIWACSATPYRGSRPSNPGLSGSGGQNHAEAPPSCIVVASGGVLSEGYGHGGPGVCLGDD